MELKESAGLFLGHPCLAKPCAIDEIIEFLENNLPESCCDEAMDVNLPSLRIKESWT